MTHRSIANRVEALESLHPSDAMIVQSVGGALAELPKERLALLRKLFEALNADELAPDDRKRFDAVIADLKAGKIDADGAFRVFERVLEGQSSTEHSGVRSMTDSTPQHIPSVIAVHEAGHAVVAHYLEQLPDDAKISIVPGSHDWWAGIVEIPNPLADHGWDFRYGSNENLIGLPEQDATRRFEELENINARYRQEAEHRVMAFLAGYIAGKRVDTKHGDGEDKPDHSQAWRLVESIVESFPEKVRDDKVLDATWAWLEARTRALLEQRWNSVMELARQLDCQGTLSGAEAASAIARGIESATP